MTENNERDLELAFLDRMLEEECGCVRAPELAERVVNPRALRSLPPPRRGARWLAAALVVLGIGVVFALSQRDGGSASDPKPAQDPEPELVEPADLAEYRKMLGETLRLELRLVEVDLVSENIVTLTAEPTPVVRIGKGPALDRWIEALASVGDRISVQTLAEPVEMRVMLKDRRKLHVLCMGGRQPHVNVQGLHYRKAGEGLLQLMAEQRRELQHRKRIRNGVAATLEELAELPAESPRVEAPDLGKAGLHHLERFTALRRLAFPGLTSRRDRMVDDAAAGMLASMPCLQQLEALSLPSGELSDAGLERLECLKALRELELLGGGSELTGRGFLQFRERGLERVRLERCAGLTVDGLRSLTELRALETLELAAPTQRALGILAELHSFRDLRHLALQGADLGGDTDVLEPLQRTRLQWLDLSGSTGILPGTLAPLADLPTLKRLDLTRVPLTDDAVDALGRLRQLDELDVTWTKLTREGVKALEEALPDAEVRAPVFD